MSYPANYSNTAAISDDEGSASGSEAEIPYRKAEKPASKVAEQEEEEEDDDDEEEEEYDTAAYQHWLSADLRQICRRESHEPHYR